MLRSVLLGHVSLLSHLAQADLVPAITQPILQENLHVIEHLIELSKPGQRPGSTQQAVAIGFADRGETDQVVARGEDVVADLLRWIADGIAEFASQRTGSTSTLGDRRQERCCLGSVGGRIVRPLVDIGERVRVIGQPGIHPDASGSYGNHGVPPVADLGDLNELGDGADHRALVTAADFAPPLDERDSELMIGRLDTVENQSAIPGFEDMQG